MPLRRGSSFSAGRISGLPGTAMDGPGGPQIGCLSCVLELKTRDMKITPLVNLDQKSAAHAPRILDATSAESYGALIRNPANHNCFPAMDSDGHQGKRVWAVRRSGSASSVRQRLTSTVSNASRSGKT